LHLMKLLRQRGPAIGAVPFTLKHGADRRHVSIVDYVETLTLLIKNRIPNRLLILRHMLAQTLNIVCPNQPLDSLPYEHPKTRLVIGSKGYHCAHYAIS
jgi:hypothetical protein